MEKLDRGLVAVQQSDGKVFLSWRLLASDPDGVAFNVYRETERPSAADPGRFAPSSQTAQTGAVRVNPQPLTAGTWLLDSSARLDRETRYFVAAVIDGVEQPRSAPYRIAAGAPAAALSLDPAADAGRLHAERRLRRRSRRRRRVRDRPAPDRPRRKTTRSRRHRPADPPGLQARRHAALDDQPRAATSAKARTTRSSWSTTSTATAAPRSSARPPTARPTAPAK